jgi:hypothetical protein
MNADEPPTSGGQSAAPLPRSAAICIYNASSLEMGCSQIDNPAKCSRATASPSGSERHRSERLWFPLESRIEASQSRVEMISVP